MRQLQMRSKHLGKVHVQLARLAQLVMQRHLCSHISCSQNKQQGNFNKQWLGCYNPDASEAAVFVTSVGM